MDAKKTNQVYTQSYVSIAANTLLFALKYYAGVVSGSIALVTDAWHTLSDSISSIVIIIGTRISVRPADEEHPFGHGRIQLVSSLMLGILLLSIGLSFLWASINKLQNHEIAHFGNWALYATLASIVVKELMAQYSFYLARQTQQMVLKADGWHHRSDAISSVILVVGIVAGKHWWWADGVLGIIMALFIFKAGYGILKEAVTPLLGEPPAKDTMQQVAQICTNLAGRNIYPHHFHYHNYGYHQELTFHIALPGKHTLAQTHLLADRIEIEIRKKLGMESTIHIDPIEEPETQADIMKHKDELSSK